jgi:hypothetical protein
MVDLENSAASCKKPKAKTKKPSVLLPRLGFWCCQKLLFTLVLAAEGYYSPYA